LVVLGFMGLLATASCGPTTKMLTSWTSPNLEQGTVKKILVLGVARDLSLRRTYEDSFVRTLQGLKYGAVPSYLWVPDMPDELNKEMLGKKIREAGVSHVIVTRLVDEKTVKTYTPPSYATVGVSPYYPGWYGSYYSYWSVGYTTMVSPGYVSESQVVSLETGLYDAEDEELIWTGITETWVSDNRTKNVDAVIKKVVYELRAKGVL
jgi:hypothetical protein